MSTAVKYDRTLFELDPVPLAVIEAHGLDTGVAVERPAEADRGILPAGKQH